MSLLPLQPASEDIWDKKYRLKTKSGEPVDQDVRATHERVARALANVETTPELRQRWYERFLWALENGAIPAGRITSNAGGEAYKPATSVINCLGAGTPVLTDRGVLPIESLVGQKVHVLNGRGHWVEVEFKSYGRQKTYPVSFRHGARRQEHAFVVRATAGHRWILDTGKVITTEYWMTGVTNSRHTALPHLSAPRPVFNESDYGAGVFHGMMYGDGHQHTSNASYYILDLIEEKVALAPWAERHLGKPGIETVYNKSGNKGLRWNFTSDFNWKQLPSKDVSPSYDLGFFSGLLSTDGTVVKNNKDPDASERSTYVEVFGGLDLIRYLEKMLPALGITPQSSSLIAHEGDINAYGTRKNDMWRLAIDPATLHAEDILRPEHRAKFTVTEHRKEMSRRWSFLSVDQADVREEEVFCCEEPETQSFAIGSGLLTGNCTVSGTISDSMNEILNKVHEAGMTLKAGCGIGYSFSTLRPKGAFVAGAGAHTSGPMSFMDIYDKMCFTVASAGGRRGAQMGTFDVAHPDVMDFIRAKREDGRLRQFNLSLLITDGFMEAVENDGDWDLVFPVHHNEANEIDLNDPRKVLWREWPDHKNVIMREDGMVACQIYKSIKARRLWDVIMASTYDYAEPGFILIDKVNAMNNNWWCENIQATNPCVVGTTRILTREGEVAIQDKVGQRVEVWNGQQWSWVTPEITGRNQKVRTIRFSNGKALTCTLYHGFFVGDQARKVEAKDLQPGDVLAPFVLPGSDRCHQIEVDAIYDHEELADTVYCFNEPQRHAGVFNGILTAQCGEQPLPPYGSCLLGSINLTSFVRDAFTPKASFDWDTYREVVRVFTRMLDNVVEINGLPLEKQRHEIMTKRRHGMGFLGLGSALTMLRVPYGNAESVKFTEDVTREMALLGWEEALNLAREKGPAPIMDQEFEVTSEMLRLRPEMPRDGYQQGDRVRGSVLHAKYSHYMQKIAELDPQLVEDLAEVGARFTHHTSIAPTGTISLSLANNASNGIEPSFAHHYSRNVIREGKKSKEKVEVFSYELLAYRALINAKAMPFSQEPETKLPAYFIAADQVTPTQHVDIQAAAQKWVDSSISKTANVPTDYPYEDFKDIYLYAYKRGLKGCTTFRFNPEAFQGVLVKEEDLAATTYRFELDDGTVIEAKGNEDIEYDGEIHSAANLFDALKEGYYGKF